MPIINYGINMGVSSISQSIQRWHTAEYKKNSDGILIDENGNKMDENFNLIDKDGKILTDK